MYVETIQDWCGAARCCTYLIIYYISGSQSLSEGSFRRRANCTALQVDRASGRAEFNTCYQQLPYVPMWIEHSFVHIVGGCLLVGNRSASS
jgi:hypothetical protein